MRAAYVYTSLQSHWRYCTKTSAPWTLASYEFEGVTLLQTLLNTPNLYLHEVQEELHDITGSFYDCATICRAPVALQRCELKRAEFISEFLEFDPVCWCSLMRLGQIIEVQSESMATAFAE